MEGAADGPRSEADLVAAARRLGDLLAVGLVTQDFYEAEMAPLRQETMAALVAPRVRSSVGNAGSPAASAAAARVAGAAPGRLAAAPTSSPAPSQATAAAAPARAAAAALDTTPRSEGATHAALRVLKPQKKLKIADGGSQSILAMPGFSKTVLSGGVHLEVKPAPLNFGRFHCSRLRCSFSTDHRNGLTLHERHCGSAEPAAAGRAIAGSAARDSDNDDDDDDGDGAAKSPQHKRRRAGEVRQDGRASNRGSVQRNRYSFAEKADILDALVEAEASGELMQTVEARFGLGSGMLSKWKEDAEVIYSQASKKLSARLTRTAQLKSAATARYPAMELRLVEEIKRYRARGRHLTRT